MKYVAVFLLGCIVAVTYYQFFIHPEPVAVVDKHQVKIDSLRKIIKLKDDTLQAVFVHIEAVEARASHLETIRKQLQHESTKTVYISYPTDSARLRVLSSLYPSLRLR